jgi:hypothetical protein
VLPLEPAASPEALDSLEVQVSPEVLVSLEVLVVHQLVDQAAQVWTRSTDYEICIYPKKKKKKKK